MNLAPARSRSVTLLLVSGLAVLVGACKDGSSSSPDGKTKAPPQTSAIAGAIPTSVITASPKATAAAPAAGAGVASCDTIKSESLCREWNASNIEAAGKDSLKKTCDGLQGAYAAVPCPPDKRVGSCGSPEGVKVFYSNGKFPLSAGDAEKNCKGIAGSWKAGG